MSVARHCEGKHMIQMQIRTSQKSVAATAFLIDSPVSNIDRWQCTAQHLSAPRCSCHQAPPALESARRRSTSAFVSDHKCCRWRQKVSRPSPVSKIVIVYAQCAFKMHAGILGDKLQGHSFYHSCKGDHLRCDVNHHGDDAA